MTTLERLVTGEQVAYPGVRSFERKWRSERETKLLHQLLDVAEQRDKRDES